MLRLIKLALAAASLVGSVYAAGLSSSAPPGNVPSSFAVTIAATTASPTGVTIPANFVGLSVENADLIAGFYQGSSGTLDSIASASSYISLAGLLGVNGVLRVGGSSSDLATAPALTQTIANNLETFVAALGSGWTIIYGLDLVANNSALAATQAGYINTSFGSKAVFQMGNEPFTTGNFTVSSYQTAWNAYYTAIIGSVTGAKFGSIDDFSWGQAQSAINGLTPGVSGLADITYHWYNTNGLLTSESAIIQSSANFAATFAENTSWAGSVPQRISETNSVNQHGVTNISNGLIASTWYLNQAITVASLGYAGTNIHSVYTYDGAGIYNPLVLNADQKFTPSPIFYGMYLFARVEGQQQIAATSNNSNLIAFATLRTANKANILLINNSTSQSAVVTPQQDAAWSTANVLQINGRSCVDLAPTIGGYAMGESGAWQGGSYSISNGASISIPPCGSALVSVQ